MYFKAFFITVLTTRTYAILHLENEMLTENSKGHLFWDIESKQASSSNICSTEVAIIPRGFLKLQLNWHHQNVHS